jgi:hypothetical protein
MTVCNETFIHQLFHLILNLSLVLRTIVIRSGIHRHCVRKERYGMVITSSWWKLLRILEDICIQSKQIVHVRWYMSRGLVVCSLNCCSCVHHHICPNIIPLSRFV